AVRASWRRLLSVMAAPPSLQGHVRLAKWIARRVRLYEFDESRVFDCDGAPTPVVKRRRAGFLRLASGFRSRAPRTGQATDALEPGMSDLQFTQAYRVPFQFRTYVRRHLPVGSLVKESDGPRVTDLDGNIVYDLTGSYGVNLFGYDFYKECID